MHAMIKENNNRNAYGWSLENGYSEKFTDGEYPLRVLDSGQNGALELILSSNWQDHQIFCNIIHSGFEVYVSVPGESIQSKKEIKIDLSDDIQITMTSSGTKIVTTSKALRSYAPMQRRCFYNSERQLRFFNLYTAHNCIVECLANFTEKECGCVQFSMPSMHRSIVDFYTDGWSTLNSLAKIMSYL